MGGMDLRTRTSLFCGVLALAIAVSVLLKGKPRLPQLFFTGLAGDIGLWYLAQWLYHVGRSDLWARWTAVLAVLLPQFTVHLFESIVPERRHPDGADAGLGAHRASARLGARCRIFVRVRADRRGPVDSRHSR